MQPCPDCAKWKADYVLQGVDHSIVHLCKCGEDEIVSEGVPQVTHSIQEGWWCPKCGRIWAPSVESCKACLYAEENNLVEKHSEKDVNGMVYYTTFSGPDAGKYWAYDYLHERRDFVKQEHLCAYQLLGYQFTVRALPEGEDR